MKPPSSFCASAAIATALTFGSTAFAQEAALPTVAPPVPLTAVPASAPGPAARVVTQSSPVVQQVPATPPVVVAEPAPAARPRPVSARPVARAASAVAAAPDQAAPVAIAASPVAAVPPAAPVAQAPEVAAAPPPVAAVPGDRGLTGGEAGLLALLAAAGLAGAGFLVARARRSRDEDEFDDPAMRAVPAAVAVPTALPDPEPEPVAIRERTPDRFAPPAAALAASGPAPAGDARAGLLERMVAAAPDEDNPFVSRKRRTARARMILAQRENRARAGVDERFDWRTYAPSGKPADAAPSAQETEPSLH